MYAAGDPVGAGLVASLSRPGGNITGYSVLSTELRVKRLELLRELLPSAQRIGELINPRNLLWKLSPEKYEAAWRALGMQVDSIEVTTPEEMRQAMVQLAERSAHAVVVPEDNLFDANAALIMSAALEHRIPAIVGDALMVRQGGWRLSRWRLARGTSSSRTSSTGYCVAQILASCP
jgi:putative ABC transport system substrate-binding protein